MENNYWDQNPVLYDYMKFWAKWGKKNTTLGELWLENTKANRETIKDLGSVWDIPKEDGKAVIIVGASPSLNEDVKKLKDLPDCYVVLAVNSALKMLLSHNVRPNYVIAVDGGPGVPLHLDVGDDSENLCLLASNSCSPQVFEKWKGEIRIIPYLALNDKELKRWVQKTFGKETPCGGNAFNSAVGVATYVMKSSVLVFMANELSWKGDNYYADKPSFNDGSLVFRHGDVRGRPTYTNTVLQQYKIWLEAFCEQNNHLLFYNVSAGILGVSQYSGRVKAIKQYTFAKMREEVEPGLAAYNDWHERERLKYNLAYSSGKYDPTVGKGAWRDLCEQIPFKRGLDVGCGPGYGIKYARSKGHEVFGVDISDKLASQWKRLGIGDYCFSYPADHLPFQDKTFDLTVCTEVMEHIPEDGVLDTLKEIRRTNCGQTYFTISNRAIPEGGVMIDNRIQPHLTVKPDKWWRKKLKDAGFVIGEYKDAGISNFYGCK
jgi:SAM-dependent methyltransferase